MMDGELIHFFLKIGCSNSQCIAMLYLPTGWLHKERKETDKCINIISKEGKMFNSYKVAVLFMRSTSNYSSEDIHTFYLFPDGDKRNSEKRRGKTGNGTYEEKKQQKRILSTAKDWIEDDETVPKGWKTKINDSTGRKCFLSRNNQVIMSTRRGAMKALIKSGAAEEEVEEMRSLLLHDGWKEFHIKKILAVD